MNFSRDSNEELDNIDDNRESPNESDNHAIQEQELHVQTLVPSNTYSLKQLDTDKTNEFCEDDENDKRQDLNRKKVL